MFRVLLLLFPLAALTGLAADRSFDHNHSVWDQVLRASVSDNGEVDYERIAQDRVGFDRYLSDFAAVSPDSNPEQFATPSQKLAYWLNAYNAFTVRGVLDNYPLESVRKVPRFFAGRRYEVGGKMLSLRDIEHEILRKRFDDPRIHAAIVCASVSCPALWKRSFTADDVDAQLEARSRAFVNQRRNVTVDAAAGRITLSKIFAWYADDFGDAEGVRAFLRRYAEPPLKTQLGDAGDAKLQYHSYDWSLNRPGSRTAWSTPAAPPNVERSR